jgi:hypothetical protein
MKENCRKVLLVFTAVCFVLAATNIMLVLHLAQHEHDKNHNPENCPVCQQAVINSNAVIPDAPSGICEASEVLFKVSYRSFFRPEPVKFQFPLLRAPPSVC